MLTYAEMHYRPRWAPSLIFRRMPEIVCDTPVRVNPGRPVPVFVFIKDAHRFPVILAAVIIQLSYADGTERLLRFPYADLAIADPFWWDVYNIVPERHGIISVRPHIVLRTGKRTRIVVVDNYRGVSHGPLAVLVADEPLPAPPGWHAGDIHCHSLFTEDPIEFGAPVEALVMAAQAFGFDWLAVTDHSYDLGSSPGRWNAPDPGHERWSDLRRLADQIDGMFTLIPGEEVTCRTAGGRNCHLLALDAGSFIEGSGDGGGHGLAAATEYDIASAVRMCREGGGIPLAAHPLEPVSLAERLVLKRGRWTDADLSVDGLAGMQVFNGSGDRGVSDGIAAWVRLLLAGKRLVLAGGSDAHGDMNRCRRVDVPLAWIAESPENTLGRARTVVRTESLSRESLLDAIGNGRAVVSTGPFADLAVRGNGCAAGPGDTAEVPCTVRAELYATAETGVLASCRILAGVPGERAERLLAARDRIGGYSATVETICDIPGAAYIRAECGTETGAVCITNPIWLRSR